MLHWRTASGRRDWRLSEECAIIARAALWLFVRHSASLTCTKPFSMRSAVVGKIAVCAFSSTGDRRVKARRGQSRASFIRLLPCSCSRDIVGTGGPLWSKGSSLGHAMRGRSGVFCKDGKTVWPSSQRRRWNWSRIFEDTDKRAYGHEPTRMKVVLQVER